MTGSVRQTRRLMATIGFFGPRHDVRLHSDAGRNEGERHGSGSVRHDLMGLASFFNDLVMPGAWATCMDVGGAYAGTVSGSMNMMGNMAGFFAPGSAE